MLHDHDDISVDDECAADAVSSPDDKENCGVNQINTTKSTKNVKQAHQKSKSVSSQIKDFSKLLKSNVKPNFMR